MILYAFLAALNFRREITFGRAQSGSDCCRVSNLTEIQQKRKLFGDNIIGDTEYLQ